MTIYIIKEDGETLKFENANVEEQGDRVVVFRSSANIRAVLGKFRISEIKGWYIA